jgi:hypothetical protein
MRAYSDEWWYTIRDAIESTPKTIRLCMIIFFGGMPPALLLWEAHH